MVKSMANYLLGFQDITIKILQNQESVTTNLQEIRFVHSPSRQSRNESVCAFLSQQKYMESYNRLQGLHEGVT